MTTVPKFMTRSFVAEMDITNGQAVADFNNLLPGFEHEFHFIGLNMNAVAELQALLSVNNGTSFITTAAAYSYSIYKMATTPAFVAAQSTFMSMTNNGVGIGASPVDSYDGIVRINLAMDAGQYTAVNAVGGGRNGTSQGPIISQCVRLNAEQNNAIRFQPASSTFKAGKIIVYRNPRQVL